MLWTQTTGSVENSSACNNKAVDVLKVEMDEILIILFKNKRKEWQVEEAAWTRAWRRECEGKLRVSLGRP